MKCNNKRGNLIKKHNGKFRVLSEKGKNMGTYDTKEEAKERLRQIEFFKLKNRKKSNLDDDLLAVAEEIGKFSKSAKESIIELIKLSYPSR